MARLTALLRLARERAGADLRKLRQPRVWLIIGLLILLGQGLQWLKSSLWLLDSISELNTQVRIALWDVNPFQIFSNLHHYTSECFYLRSSGSISCDRSDWLSDLHNNPQVPEGLFEVLWGMPGYWSEVLKMAFADIWHAGLTARIVLLGTFAPALILALLTCISIGRERDSGLLGSTAAVLIFALPIANILAGLFAFVLLVLLIALSYAFGAILGLVVWFFGPVCATLYWIYSTIRQGIEVDTASREWWKKSSNQKPPAG